MAFVEGPENIGHKLNLVFHVCPPRKCSRRCKCTKLVLFGVNKHFKLNMLLSAQIFSFSGFAKNLGRPSI